MNQPPETRPPLGEERRKERDEAGAQDLSRLTEEVTGMRAIAVVGWLGIVGALLVWQGIGLVRGPEWPTLSDFFRSFMTVPLGRFLLFGLWLWLGWHLFIRGWSFFLRS